MPVPWVSSLSRSPCPQSSTSTFLFGLQGKKDVRPQLTSRLRMLEIEELVGAEEHVKGIEEELGADTQVTMTSAVWSHRLNLEVLVHIKWDYVLRTFCLKKAQEIAIFSLYIGGKWVSQLDLETVSVRQSVNSVHSDVYVCYLVLCHTCLLCSFLV